MELKKILALLLVASSVAAISQTAFAQTNPAETHNQNSTVSQKETTAESVIYTFWHRNLYKESNMTKVGGTFTLNFQHTVTFRVFQHPTNDSDKGKPISAHYILQNDNTGTFVPVIVNGEFYNAPATLSPGTYSMYYINKSDFPINFDAFVISP